ncbi:MAG: TetR family transcriptional regulator [Proteobacteria bacterium]|nr:TetR family transcriptional regulator [Pseudomonadota bacterium]
MLALVREGVVAPGAEAVAERAKVGLRTVFRHFENMDGLYREMNVLMEREILPLFQAPYAGRTWREKLAELLARRAEIFERIMQVKIAADVHRHHSAFLRAESRRIVKYQRAALEALLPADIARERPLLEALDLTLSFESWRRLRQEQKLSRQQAQVVVTDMVGRLIAK